MSDGLEPDGLHAGHVHGRSPRGAVVRPARVLREGDTVGPDGEIQRDPHTEEDGEGNNRSVSTDRAAVCRLMVFGFFFGSPLSCDMSTWDLNLAALSNSPLLMSTAFGLVTFFFLGLPSATADAPPSRTVSAEVRLFLSSM